MTSTDRNKPVKTERMFGATITTEEGYNTGIIALSREIANLPKFSLYTATPEQTEQRIDTYFSIMQQHDMKPSISYLALSLGVNRSYLWEVKTGNYTQNHKHLSNDIGNLIKKAYDMVEAITENYLSNGKVNPAAGIFILKNNFNWKDVQETILTPNTELQADTSEIRNRYIDNSEK